MRIKFIHIILLLMSGFIYAGEADNSAELTIVTEETFPLHYMKEGKASGVVVDYLNHVLATAGISADINIMPWARAYKVAQEEKNVLIFSLARTPNREKEFVWLDEILTLKYYLYSLSDKAVTLSNKDLKNANIGVVNGSITHHFLKENGYNNLITVQGFEQLASLLNRNRADLIISSPLGPKFYEDKIDADLDLVPVMEFNDLTVSLYFAMNINSDERLVERLKESFSATKSHPTALELDEI